MTVNVKSVKKVEIEANGILAEEVLDNISAYDMAMVFNNEKILERRSESGESAWNDNMIDSLNENGRKHIKKLYDMVCKWYEANPEDAEAEGYMEW